MSMHIRPATARDLPAIRDIYNEAIRETTASFDVEEKTMADREAWFAAHGGRYPVLVADVEGVVAGWASLSPYSERTGYACTVENSVYVRSGYCGRGLGTQLLELLMHEARTLGYRVVIARIVADNAVSIALHRKCGFTDVGVMHQVGWKFGRWLDVLFMEAVFPANEIEE